MSSATSDFACDIGHARYAYRHAIEEVDKRNIGSGRCLLRSRCCKSSARAPAGAPSSGAALVAADFLVCLLAECSFTICPLFRDQTRSSLPAFGAASLPCGSRSWSIRFIPSDRYKRGPI